MSEKLKIFLNFLNVTLLLLFFSFRGTVRVPRQSLKRHVWNYSRDRGTNYASVLAKCANTRGRVRQPSLIILLVSRGVGHDDPRAGPASSCPIFPWLSIATFSPLDAIIPRCPKAIFSVAFSNRFCGLSLGSPHGRTVKGSLKSNETCVAFERKMSIHSKVH